MSSLSERLTRGSASPSQVDHARRLVADWQLLADLSFADLTLWVPVESGAWWCVAQVRPLTAPTTQPEDLVGVEVGAASAESFRAVHRDGVRASQIAGDGRRTRELLPVRHDGVVVAVLARDTFVARDRARSALEQTYLALATVLCAMVSAGTYPPDTPLDSELSPRVG